MRKRKTTYPPAKTGNRPPPVAGEPVTRSTVATINLQAAKGRSGLAVGGRFRMTGSGRYAGEIVTIEKLISGPISQALVRTDAGQTTRARTIDLVPAGDEPPAPPPAPAGDASPA